MIKILNTIPAEEFSNLYDMLNKIKMPLTGIKNGRHNFPRHRKIVFGITKGRFNGITGLSRESLKYPEIFEEVLRIGDKYCPFNYTSIHLNHNVICPPHKDSNNKIESFIVSFGKYEGCKLVIENEIYDTFLRPIIFDGSKLEHYNTNDLIGNKYSLVFY